MKHKKLLIAFLLFIFFIIYIYVLAIDAIPNNVILFKGEQLNIKNIWGISITNKNFEYEAILTSTQEDAKLEAAKLEVKLFNFFDVKDIDVNVIERTKIVPVGQVSGMKLYTSGVLVVGMSEIKGMDNKKYKPYENCEIKEGDTIIEIEGRIVSDTRELVNAVNLSEGEEITIKYLREGNIFECNVTPIKTSNEEYKIGLWVRDSAAGIGTLTYYEPESGSFAALGHGITDIDTGNLLNISNGEFITTKIISIIKGKDGNPGKIQGMISDQTKIGTIYKNSAFGIYGKMDNLSNLNIDVFDAVDVATRDEIELGDAKLLCSLDGEKAKEYKIQIEKVYLNNNYDNKSMLIKVTDDELIQKTGGIIQGMSGYPVIQNVKFVGAVTNVLVSDSTKGYVVFGDLMIKEMNK